jgi:hypothetical protein
MEGDIQLPAVLETGFDGVMQISDRKHYFCYAETTQIANEVLQKGSTCNLQHRLGQPSR